MNVQRSFFRLLFSHPSQLTLDNSHPLSFHMTTKSEQPTGLPVMLQHGSARLPVSAFNPPLGTSYDVQIQFALKPTAFCCMPAQKFYHCRAAVLPDQFILQ